MPIEVRRLSGAMGAEIFGVDLSQKLSDERWKEIRAAYNEHLAIFFPDQHLLPPHIIAFVERFGTPSIHPYLKPVNKDYPFVHELRKEPSHTINYGGAWHTDFTFVEKPNSANALYARITPEYGGDTMFANLYLAYDALSEGMKKLFDGVRLLSATGAFLDLVKVSPVVRDDTYEHLKNVPPAAHPVFRTIPETGRKCLYIDPGAALSFENMTVEESRPIINYLIALVQRPEFQFRYRWRPDVFGIWDNRCLIHYAVNDYPGQLRVMHRMSVVDTERPR
jgi:taurine dioxygenase